jgi:hypothetical protein
MTKSGQILAAMGLLLWAGPVLAQATEEKGNVVRAEAPIVAGNAVNAKKRALADAFRQATERVFAEIVKEGAPAAGATSGVAQLKASLASAAQKFVRSYRLIEQQTEDGVLRVMVEVDVDTVLMRREIERARGAGGPPQPLPVRPIAGVLLVAGAAPAGAAVVTALGANGVRAQLAPVVAEAQLLQSAARQNAYALSVAGSSAGEGKVRGSASIAVKCSLSWRLFGTGDQAARGPAAERVENEYGFASDENVARTTCFERVAGAVARAVAGSLRTPVVSAPFVTLRLDIPGPGVVPLILHALKRLGAVNASEIRHLAASMAEIRVFTRIGGQGLLQVLAREVAGKVLLVPVQTASDLLVLRVQGTESSPGEENR